MYYKTPGAFRFDILARDRFQCQYCGRSPALHGVVLHLDHLIPKCEGGSDHPDNLITACEDCNHGKAYKTLSQTTQQLEITRYMVRQCIEKALDVNLT